MSFPNAGPGEGGSAWRVASEAEWRDLAESPHNRIIKTIARDTLRPLGLVQKGRSRTWLDDHGWWVTVVVFESSSYGDMSVRLKIAAMWLWHDLPLGTIVYSRGRGTWGAPTEPGRWIAYESEAQFEPEVRRIAVMAADEVSRYRSWIQSFQDCAESCDRSTHDLRMLDAAIAWGLAGDVRRARSALARYDDVTRRLAFRSAEEKARKESQAKPPPAWELEAEQRDRERSSRVRALRDLISERSLLAEHIGVQISAHRAALGLPPFDLSAAVAA